MATSMMWPHSFRLDLHLLLFCTATLFSPLSFSACKCFTAFTLSLNSCSMANNLSMSKCVFSTNCSISIYLWTFLHKLRFRKMVRNVKHILGQMFNQSFAQYFYMECNIYCIFKPYFLSHTDTNIKQKILPLKFQELSTFWNRLK